MLSLEQQKTIENSIWVVNTALKRQGLQHDEDLRQSAILHMCKCIEKFDPSKEIKWTTYAYKNVFLFVKRRHKKEVAKNSMLINDDVFAVIENSANCSYENKFSLLEIKSLCNKKECEVIDLKMQGYKAEEISALMGCKAQKIRQYMRSIKNKARERL